MDDNKEIQKPKGLWWKLVSFFVVMCIAVFGAYKFYQAESVKKESYKDNLSFVAIVKNEGPYIKEWIEYHKMVGVDRFYIYDNESTDNLEGILSDYIKSGEVVYKYYPGKIKQLPAYQEAIKDYKDQTKYMGFIDIDEFVIPVNSDNLFKEVDEIISKDPKNAGVGINWRIYGSSGLEEKPEGLVTENYKLRAPDDFDRNKHIKTICNPRLALDSLDPHSFNYQEGYHCVNEDGQEIYGPFNEGGKCQKLRINHYFSKSKEEYMQKKIRGFADVNAERTMQAFYEHDRNDVYDYIMERFVKTLKTRVWGICNGEQEIIAK